MTSYVTVYITTSDRDEARRIGRSLVEDRLAACANILDGMTSIYPWNGKVEEAGETVLLLKTRAALVPGITGRVTEMHSYTCPCIVVWPINGGHPEYLDWIGRETRPSVE